MAAEDGLIQVRFSGQIAHIMAVFENIKKVMPKGDARCKCGYKEDANGVTARLYVNLPPEFLGVLSSVAAAAAKPATAPGLALPRAADMVYEAEMVETPPPIDQRFKVSWRR